jgi:hypothetical protein
MKLPNIFEKEVTPLSFSGGSVIFGEGQKRDSMYVVKSGEVELKVGDTTVEVVGRWRSLEQTDSLAKWPWSTKRQEAPPRLPKPIVW